MSESNKKSYGEKKSSIIPYIVAGLLICGLISFLNAGNKGKESQVTDKKATACGPVCGLPTSDEELKKILTPEQYRITKENGTERPFHNAYWDNKKLGIYVCVISGDPLFSSKDKFDSGTGWPSFTAPIQKGNIVEKEDRSYGMVRVEVRAKKSDSHLGHLFPDGPQPTGMRYCINSASLKFIPVEELKKAGYEKYESLFEGLEEKDSK